MKLFWSYLKTKWKSWTAFLLFAAVFFAVFALYRLPFAAVAYPFAICAVSGGVFLLADFLRMRKKHSELQRLISLTAQMIELPDGSDSFIEEDYRQLIRSLKREMADSDAQNAVRYREMIDYYTVWAHQIKTPIASMKLALQNEDSELSRRLSSDLFRTQQYVEMVLTFLRLDSDTGDYVFKRYSLDAVIRSCVRKFAPEFIGRKLSLSYEPITLEIVTDEKWFSFVLEQLLSNALKYTRTGGITIALENESTLTVRDTGIGIAPEDLPRVFEKGYTGYNGRTDKAASGLGLYLCRRICENLGLTLSIDSAVHVGTTVKIGLPAQKAVAE